MINFSNEADGSFINWNSLKIFRWLFSHLKFSENFPITLLSFENYSKSWFFDDFVYFLGTRQKSKCLNTFLIQKSFINKNSFMTFIQLVCISSPKWKRTMFSDVQQIFRYQETFVNVSDNTSLHCQRIHRNVSIFDRKWNSSQISTVKETEIPKLSVRIIYEKQMTFRMHNKDILTVKK